MSDQPQYPSYPGDDSSGGVPPGYGQTPPPGYQPPPPPGYQPPPPGYGQTPPAYGQAPPAYGQAPGYGQQIPNYASWGSRVGAYLLDSLIAFAIVVIPLVVGAVIAFKDLEYIEVTDEFVGEVAPLGIIIMILGALLGLLFDLWNRGIRVGTTGQSLGKKIVGISVVKADTGAFLGAGGGFLRWLVAIVFSGITCLGLIDVLWPLWDDRKQTLHDKVVSTVAIRV